MQNQDLWHRDRCAQQSGRVGSCVSTLRATSLTVLGLSFVCGQALAFALSTQATAAGQAANQAPNVGTPSTATPAASSQRAPGESGNQDGESQGGSDAASPRRGRDGRGGRLAMPLPPDWPRAGGFGGRERPLMEGLVGEEFLGDLARRELTDEELARALRLASRVSEEWGKTLAARAEQDPVQLKLALRTTGRRLLSLMSIEERSPELFEAKIAELQAQGETARASEALRRAEESAAAPSTTTGAESTAVEGEGQKGLATEELAALRRALDVAIAKQVDATLIVRREEIAAIEARLARAKADVERDAADPTALRDEVRQRAFAPRDGRAGQERGSERGNNRGAE